MSLGTILLIIFVLLLIGVFPGFPHGGWGYGYAPFGGVGFILLIVIILVVLGRI
jgi:hypothetical protein